MSEERLVLLHARSLPSVETAQGFGMTSRSVENFLKM
jgi:hypothetical protein